MNLANMKRSETTEQINLFNWARSIESFVPELKLMYHIPNEGKRSNGTGALLKAAGMKAGVPDIHLPVARNGYTGLYIEMKYGKNTPSKEQKEFMVGLLQEGHKVEVAYSMQQAREVIRKYLQREKGFNLVNCEEAPKIFGKCEGVQKAPKGVKAPCESCKYHKCENVQ